MLRPTTYRSMLKDADAVVHSMGILLEADYKGVLTGKESIWNGLSRAFSATKAGSQNPLERKEGEDLEPMEKDGQLTYELMNRDTGVALSVDQVITALTQDIRSHNPSAGSFFPQRPLVRLHIRCRRGSHAAEKIHHHKTRSRIHHCILTTQAS